MHYITPFYNIRLLSSVGTSASAFMPGSNDSAVVSGIYRLRSAAMETWHPGGRANFTPFLARR